MVFYIRVHYLMNLLIQTTYNISRTFKILFAIIFKLSFKNNLEIFDRNNTHGGSIRVYVARKKCYNIDSSVKKILKSENNLKKNFFNFKNKILSSKIGFYNLLNTLYKKKNNLKIAGISAPSRSTTLINYLGLDESIIDCIFEIKGSKKIGMYLPGTKIKIIEEDIRKLKKYDYLVIFSWHIKKDIIKAIKKEDILESL